MKRNSVFHLLPLLLVVAAIAFAYCTKETPASVLDQTEPVIDRTHCSVTVTMNSGTASICGTNTSLAQCSAANYLGNPLFGSEILAGGQQAVYGVESPSSLKFTFSGPVVPSVTITTAGGSVTLPSRTAPNNEVYFDNGTCQPHAL